MDMAICALDKWVHRQTEGQISRQTDRQARTDTCMQTLYRTPEGPEEHMMR